MDSNLVIADVYAVVENKGDKCSLKIRYGVSPEKSPVGKIRKDYLEMAAGTTVTAFQLSS